MKIEQVIKEQQPKVHKKLNKKKKCRMGKESLSFSNFENMMRHDSYRRGGGGVIRRVR